MTENTIKQILFPRHFLKYPKQKVFEIKLFDMVRNMLDYLATVIKGRYFRLINKYIKHL